MLFFQWERINWVKWMPVEVGVLLILILFIRLLRRYRRWNQVEISHVKKSVWKWQEYCGNFYENQINLQFSKNIPIELSSPKIEGNSLKNHHLLFIPPVQGSLRVESVMASSLAICGISVWSIPPKIFYKILAHPNHAREFFLQFIEEHSIDTVILFDHAIFPYFSCLISDHSINSSLKENIRRLDYILIRPFWDLSNIKNFLKLICNPLQALYFLNFLRYRRVFLQLSKFKHNNPDDYTNLSIPKIQAYKQIIRRILCIHPAKSWLTSSAHQQITKWTHSLSGEEFTFSRGDWWFFRNETILLGIIAKFIHLSR
ncbi:MAG: hypothetical protein ACTSWC_11685 [Promethearchaeota archaeon]